MKVLVKRIGICLLIAALCRGAAAFEEWIGTSGERGAITEFAPEPKETEIVDTEETGA